MHLAKSIAFSVIFRIKHFSQITEIDAYEKVNSEETDQTPLGAVGSGLDLFV